MPGLWHRLRPAMLEVDLAATMAVRAISLKGAIIRVTSKAAR
jgi:hypothetical protein